MLHKICKKKKKKFKLPQWPRSLDHSLIEILWWDLKRTIYSLMRRINNKLK